MIPVPKLCLLIFFVATLTIIAILLHSHLIGRFEPEPDIPEVTLINEELHVVQDIKLINLETISRNAPKIFAVTMVALTLALVITVIILYIVRIENYIPPDIEKGKNAAIVKENDIPPSAFEKFKEYVSRNLWYLPHFAVLTHLIASAAFVFWKEPAQRLGVVLSMIFILAVYILAIYRSEPNDRFWSFMSALTSNLKWASFLFIAYFINRLFKRELKELPEETSMALEYFKTLLRILLPFGPILWGLAIKVIAYIGKHPFIETIKSSINGIRGKDIVVQIDGNETDNSVRPDTSI